MSLYDYYGGHLPSITERAGIYRQHGGTGNYMGTAQQNNFLEGKLRGGGSAPGTSVSFGGAPQPSGYGEVQSAFDKLSSARAGLEDPTARYKRLAGETGVTAQQETLANLMRQLNTQQGLLTNLEPDINKRLQGLGTAVTEAQRRRWLGAESAPITKSIGDISTAKATEQGALDMKNQTLADLMNAANQGDQNAIQNLSDALDYAKGKYGAVQSEKAAAKSRSSGGSAKKATAPTTYSNSEFTDATGILDQYDTGGPSGTIDHNPSDTGDRSLSKNQAQGALNELKNRYGAEKAALLFQSLFSNGGYKTWGGYNINDLNL